MFPPSDGTPPLQGIDQGTLVMGLRSHSGTNQEPVFMVWLGEQGGGEIGGASEVPPKDASLRIQKFEGSLAGIKITCRTTDGKNGSVSLGDQTFELDKGGLFLVSKTGPEVAIKQMMLARMNLRPEGSLRLDQMTNEYFRRMAKTDSEFRAFWDEAEGRKSLHALEPIHNLRPL
jgi:hypothetical protein